MTGLKNKLYEFLEKSSTDFGFKGAMAKMTKDPLAGMDELIALPERKLSRNTYKLRYQQLSNAQLCQALADACVITLNYVINSSANNSPKNKEDASVGNFATAMGALLEVASQRLRTTTDLAPQANIDFKGGASRLSSLERLLFSYACTFDKAGYKVPNLDWITQAREGKAGIFPVDLTKINEYVNDYYFKGMDKVIEETDKKLQESCENVDSSSPVKLIAEAARDFALIASSSAKLLGKAMLIGPAMIRDSIKGVPADVAKEAIEEARQLQLAGDSEFLEPGKIKLIVPDPQIYKHISTEPRAQKANGVLPPQKDGGR